MSRKLPLSNAETDTPKPSLKDFMIVFTVFGCYVSLMGCYFIFLFPQDENFDKLTIPNSIASAKQFTKILDTYTQSNLLTVMLGFSMIYTFLQCFSIPGSTLLNLCAGALFGFKLGFFLCVVNSALGASLAYGISYVFGRGIIYYFFSAKLVHWSNEVEKHRHNIFSYLLFLRITPFLPNWFINLAAPVLRIPFWPFCWATLVGVMPQTFLQVQVGLSLTDMDESSGFSFLNLKNVLLLTALGCLSLLPAIPCVRQQLSRLLVRDTETDPGIPPDVQDHTPPIIDVHPSRMIS